MSKFSSWASGAFWGGFLSSAAVLLLTPYSGTQIKQSVRDYFKNISEQIMLAGEDKRAELEAELTSLRSGE